MRSRARSTDRPCRHRGFMLLEAVITMVVVGLVVSASVYAVGRGAKTQYTAQLRAQIVEQLHAMLMSQGVALCTASTVPPLVIDQRTYAVTVSKTQPYCQSYGSVIVKLPGNSATSINMPTTQATPMSLSATAEALGGTVTVSSH